MIELKNCRFKEHPYPNESGWIGYIMNGRDNIIAYINLDGSIKTI